MDTLRTQALSKRTFCTAYWSKSPSGCFAEDQSCPSVSCLFVELDWRLRLPQRQNSLDLYGDLCVEVVGCNDPTVTERMRFPALGRRHSSTAVLSAVRVTTIEGTKETEGVDLSRQSGGVAKCKHEDAKYLGQRHVRDDW